MTQKKHKLDIFEVLGKISKKDTEFYRNLSEDEQKALQPLVVMRWLSGTSDARQIFFLNELVNPLVFSLAKHKELLVDLMTICGPGQARRYNWVKANNKKTSNMPITVKVIQEYFGYSSNDAIESIQLLTDEAILGYAEQLGTQPDQIKALTKELKTRAKG